jgi:large subunit ribosomal protein L21
VERVTGDPGSTVEFNHVFVVRNEKLTVGAPLVANAKVTGKILTNDRAAKVRVLKYKRKKQYRRTIGHRQHFSQVLIQDIVTGIEVRNWKPEAKSSAPGLLTSSS